MHALGVKKFKYLLILLNILNIFDAALTRYWIQTEQCYELNPLFQCVAKDPFYFWLFKILLVILGSYILYKQREHFFAQLGTIVVTCVYLSIIIYHVWYII